MTQTPRPTTKTRTRYCGMCDDFTPKKECPKCGADTDKWPGGGKLDGATPRPTETSMGRRAKKIVKSPRFFIDNDSTWLYTRAELLEANWDDEYLAELLDGLTVGAVTEYGGGAGAVFVIERAS